MSTEICAEETLYIRWRSKWVIDYCDSKRRQIFTR